MQNPFSPKNQGEANLKRNSYDLSFDNLFTTDFGRETPVLSQEVIPGDTIRFTPSISIQGMPTVFPVQTRIRASMSFYYCRNRCVHENFEDYIFRTKDVEAPWLHITENSFDNYCLSGSIGDYMGVPTTVGGCLTTQVAFPSTLFYAGNRTALSSDYFTQVYATYFGGDSAPYHVFPQYISREYYKSAALAFRFFELKTPLVSNHIYVSATVREGLHSSFTHPSFRVYVADSTNRAFSYFSYSLSYINNSLYEILLDESFYTLVKTLISAGGCNLWFCYSAFTDGVLTPDYAGFPLEVPISPYVTTVVDWTTFYYQTTITSIDHSTYNSSPFVGDTPAVPINALPFRHYEMIHNYYYRNDKNNPFYVGGEPQYNEFIPTKADGADDTLYQFHYSNWEYDRFTSCVQSPQFGEAPLVGLSVARNLQTADLYFGASQDSDAKLDDNDGTNRYKITVGLDQNGQIESIADFDKTTPVNDLRRVQELVNYGISINDLRVTNSFQRFLENTLRRGLRYRNQLKSHFGVNVDYPDIDVPQYIGGFSFDMNVSKITNTAQSSSAALGDFGGQLSGQGQGRQITCYCPEHGYIMGILTINPVPNYPQALKKSLSKISPFDYYLPEFSKIGYVPVRYSELQPISNGDVNDVFGYQKAYYDYMQNIDEVHGDFRESLSDFILTRTFAERPVLGSDFVEVHPEQLTNIFVVNNVTDSRGSNAKFLCNAHFQMTAARPIPRIGTPSLE